VVLFKGHFAVNIDNTIVDKKMTIFGVFFEKTKKTYHIKANCFKGVRRQLKKKIQTLIHIIYKLYKVSFD
jgi:hypothetical protein